MPAMKTPLSLLLLALPVLGQVYVPPSPQNNTNRPPTDTTTRIDNSNNKTKSPYGEEIPMLDPAAETITVGGVSPDRSACSSSVDISGFTDPPGTA